MATSEKLIIVANNTEKVFNAGYNKCLKENPPGASEEELQQKYDEGYSNGWRDGASSATDLWYQNGYGDGKREGIEEGKQAEYDAFWDNYQMYGGRTGYDTAFAGAGWNNETFKPKYNIVPNNAYMIFRMCSYSGDLVELLNSLNISLDLSQATNTQYLFSGSLFTHIGIVDTTSSTNTTLCENTFGGCRELITIDKVKFKQGAKIQFSNTFTYCEKLESVIFEGVLETNGLNLQWSKKLNRASIESIINCLSTTTTGLTVTLSAEAVANAFTDAEWAALEATKTNWNISLV